MRYGLISIIIIGGFVFTLSLLNKNVEAQPFSAERQFSVQYSATMKAFPQTAQSIKVWVPLASSRDGQEIISRKITVPVPYEIKKDSKLNNEILYFEVPVDQLDLITVVIDYEAKLNQESYRNSSLTEDLTPFLDPSKLMVVNSEVKQRAQEATQGKGAVQQKAKGIFDYVINHMSYDKSVPGYGKGDTIRACDIAKGNCTDFHSLFISMSLAENIPARFKIGLPIPESMDEGKIKGYHCWAEYYHPEEGWQQVDASEAKKNPERKETYFGGIDTGKFLISVGRDVELSPPNAGDPVNIFFYPYVEVDGEPFNEISTEFYFKNKTA